MYENIVLEVKIMFTNTNLYQEQIFKNIYFEAFFAFAKVIFGHHAAITALRPRLVPCYAYRTPVGVLSAYSIILKGTLFMSLMIPLGDGSSTLLQSHIIGSTIFSTCPRLNTTSQTSITDSVTCIILLHGKSLIFPLLPLAYLAPNDAMS